MNNLEKPNIVNFSTDFEMSLVTGELSIKFASYVLRMIGKDNERHLSGVAAESVDLPASVSSAIAADLREVWLSGSVNFNTLSCLYSDNSSVDAIRLEPSLESMVATMRNMDFNVDLTAEFLAQQFVEKIRLIYVGIDNEEISPFVVKESFGL